MKTVTTTITTTTNTTVGNTTTTDTNNTTPNADTTTNTKPVFKGKVTTTKKAKDTTELTHKETFVQVMKNYLLTLPKEYMVQVEDKSKQYSKFLESALKLGNLGHTLDIAYDVISRHGRIEKNYLVGQLRAELPRVKVNEMSSYNYEVSLLRFSAEILNGCKLTGVLLFETKIGRNEILLPKRSGFPVVLNDEIETPYNHLYGISSTNKYLPFTRIKGSTEKRKLDNMTKHYLSQHSSMEYRVKQWISKDEISHIVNLECIKELKDFDNNLVENKGDRTDIVRKYSTMKEQLIELQQRESFKIGRFLDGRGRIYSMFNLYYSKIGKMLIEPINSYVMSNEDLIEVKYHAVCTVHGKQPYNTAIEAYNDSIEDELSITLDKPLTDTKNTKEALEWITTIELLTLLNTKVGEVSSTNLGADYTNMGLMTHASMSRDALALDMANLGNNTVQYDSHTVILDKLLNTVQGDSRISLMVNLLETNISIEEFKKEYPTEESRKTLHSELRKGVKKLISQGLFHGQSSAVVAERIGITEEEVISFKINTFGKAIMDVERIAMWMKFNIDETTSNHSWLAPDGVRCYSQYYNKSAYSVLYTNNPNTKDGYSSTQYICELPLLKIGKNWFKRELPSTSRIKTRVNQFKLMGGYANIAHSWDGFNMRSIVLSAISLGINMVDIHDYIYSTPKMLRLAREIAKQNYISYTTEHGNYFENVINHIAKYRKVYPLTFTNVEKSPINKENMNCFTV